MYKQYIGADGKVSKNISLTNMDGVVWYIPADPANTDYQAYLLWIEQGGVPLPADEVTE